MGIWDATEAFDRVDFDKLFNLRMISNSKPLYIRLLCNVCLNAKLKVSYNAVTSKCFVCFKSAKAG